MGDPKVPVCIHAQKTPAAFGSFLAGTGSTSDRNAAKSGRENARSTPFCKTSTNQQNRNNSSVQPAPVVRMINLIETIPADPLEPDLLTTTAVIHLWKQLAGPQVCTIPGLTGDLTLFPVKARQVTKDLQSEERLGRLKASECI